MTALSSTSKGITLMSSFKLVCVAATMAASLVASQAFADCSKSEEVSLARMTTSAVSQQVSDAQHQKVMRIYDCDSYEGVLRASFVYNYVNNDGVQQISGNVSSENGRITTLDISSRSQSVAMNDKDSYTETTYGRYPYQ